jgi:hypothetical protein
MIIDNDTLVDHAFLHVKKENMKRSDDQQKMTVMGYLNQMKAKLEKIEETNNAAMMGDDYIKEVDEYSEETHSDDMYGNGNRRKKTEKQSTSKSKDTNEETKKIEQVGQLTEEQ